MRVQLFVLPAAAALVLVLGTCAGCSVMGSGGAGNQGISSDTEYASVPVTLTVYADEYLKKSPVGDAYGTDVVGEMEMIFKDSGEGKNVSFSKTIYLPSDELVAAATSDPDADVLVCNSELMDQAVEDGVVYGGRAGTSVKDLKAAGGMRLCIIRKAGSKKTLPDGDEIDSKVENGGVGALSKLNEVKGKVAVAPEDTYQGKSANLELTQLGFYSDESGTGGSYTGGAEDVITVAESVDDAVKMVAKGKVDFALVYTWDVNDDDRVEVMETYTTGTGCPEMRGASLAQSEDGAVARDFLQYWAGQV